MRHAAEKFIFRSYVSLFQGSNRLVRTSFVNDSVYIGVSNCVDNISKQKTILVGWIYLISHDIGVGHDLPSLFF